MTEASRFRRMSDEARMPVWTPAGASLYAHLLNEQGRPTTAILPPRNTRPIRTGLILEPLPDNWHYFIISRDALAVKSVFAVNTIPDYNNEIEVFLYNGGFETQYIKHGDGIAKLVTTKTSERTER